MFYIVKNLLTFVKWFVKMKTEEEIRDILSRQIKKFLSEYVGGAVDDLGHFLSSEIAKQMNQDAGMNKFTKQYVNAQLKSPQLSFISWLEEKHHLNIEWLFHGEENHKLKPLKL